MNIMSYESTVRVSNLINKIGFKKVSKSFKSLLKNIYLIFMFPFTRRGILIGGTRLNYYFVFRHYERADRTDWINYCKDKIVFDIGAHIGLYAIPASKVCKKVCAFEPAAANLNYLREHLKFNKVKNVEIYPFLIGEKNSERMFWESKNTNVCNSIHIRKGKDYSGIMRKQFSLDYFVERKQIIPDILKIDTEGAELNVLKGAENTIKKYSPIMFLSIHPRDVSISEIDNFISYLGYVYTKELKNREYIVEKRRCNMKKLIVLFVLVVFVLSVMPVMAEESSLIVADPVSKIDNRISELQVQAKDLMDKKTQLQNGLVQIDQQLLKLQGAFDELTRQKAELEPKEVKEKK